MPTKSPETTHPPSTVDGVFLDNAECCVDSFWEAFEKYWLEHGGIPE